MKTLVIPEKSIHTGNLILVNSQHPCHAEIAECSLVSVGADYRNVLMERRAAVLLSRLMNDLGGWSQICAVSGWRSMREQQDIYEKSIKENGESFTDQFVARPGHSEHQTGLAMDLGLKKPDIDFICPDFPYSGICQIFREKAAAYGFIERYPNGKEAITGIAQEPWHFRYVGMPHAAIMTELGLTLEEYHAFLKEYPHGKKCIDYRNGSTEIVISYVEAAAGAATELEINADIPCSVSGNNTEGFVVTEWRSISNEPHSIIEKEVSKC